MVDIRQADDAVGRRLRDMIMLLSASLIDDFGLTIKWESIGDDVAGSYFGATRTVVVNSDTAPWEQLRQLWQFRRYLTGGPDAVPEAEIIYPVTPVRLATQS